MKELVPVRRWSSGRHRPFQILAILCLFSLSCGAAVGASGNPLVDGISFAARPEELYLPLAEAGRLLGWRVRFDQGRARLNFNGRTLPGVPRHALVDGTPLVSMTDLEAAGARILTNEGGDRVLVSGRRGAFTVIRGRKRVEISLGAQDLKAWQGQRLVLDSRISSGRNGSTPGGNFRAGPYKARMHYSSRYDNAPMPWSVQVNGHVFIHGYTSVPRYPASHGCIRLPLNEGNPARFFYEWIDVGTPVRVRRS